MIGSRYLSHCSVVPFVHIVNVVCASEGAHVDSEVLTSVEPADIADNVDVVILRVAESVLFVKGRAIKTWVLLVPCSEVIFGVDVNIVDKVVWSVEALMLLPVFISTMLSAVLETAIVVECWSAEVEDSVKAVLLVLYSSTKP